MKGETDVIGVEALKGKIRAKGGLSWADLFRRSPRSFGEGGEKG